MGSLSIQHVTWLQLSSDLLKSADHGLTSSKTVAQATCNLKEPLGDKQRTKVLTFPARVKCQILLSLATVLLIPTIDSSTLNSALNFTHDVCMMFRVL
jgi:hypothetical protein